MGARERPRVAQRRPGLTRRILSGGRFRLGLGSGENLNERVVGQRWPAVGERHEMLAEAVDIIAALLDGEDLNFRGKHFSVESARLWDRPDVRPPIGLAVSGKQSCTLAGEKTDLMIAVEPKPELGEMFDAAGGAGSSFEGATANVAPEQVAEQLSCGPDVDEHVEAIKPFLDAGFDEVALVQIGAAQQEAFIAWAEAELLPALRSL